MYVCIFMTIEFSCFRPPSRYVVEYVSSNEVTPHQQNGPGPGNHSGESSTPTWFPFKPFPAQLISNERVTAGDHFQDTRLIRLDITGSNIRYYNVGFSFYFIFGNKT